MLGIGTRDPGRVQIVCPIVCMYGALPVGTRERRSAKVHGGTRSAGRGSRWRSNGQGCPGTVSQTESHTMHVSLAPDFGSKFESIRDAPGARVLVNRCRGPHHTRGIIVMSDWGVHGARATFQGIVEDLMRTLLEDHPTLLGETDMSNLMDAGYCKDVLELNIANFALLRHRELGHMIQGHARYWKHVYAGEYYVCSQWWKDHHRSNAAALSQFASGLAGRRPQHPGVPVLLRHIEALDRYAASGDPSVEDGRQVNSLGAAHNG